jgi:DNA-directed RNA polymerase subunit RPC12/RpoP
MAQNKAIARELAKAFWQSPAGGAAKAQGYGVCDYCDVRVAVGDGYLTGPMTETSEMEGMFATFGLQAQATGDVSPSMACESCYDDKGLSPWDGDSSALPPKHAAAFEPVAKRARQLRSGPPPAPQPVASPPAKAGKRESTPPIKFTCPSCSKVLRVRVTSEGKKIQCPACQYRTIVPPRNGGEETTGKPTPPPPKPAPKAVASAPPKPAPKAAPQPGPKAKPAAGSDWQRRARTALAAEKPDEGRLAKDETYRITKVGQFGEICSLAVECAQKASRPKVADEVKRIQVGTTLLMIAWGNVRPVVERQPLALLKLALMLSLGWTMPVAVVSWFGLSELGEFQSEAKLLETLHTTADQVEQLLTQLGLGGGSKSAAGGSGRRKRWWQFWK